MRGERWAELCHIVCDNITGSRNEVERNRGVDPRLVQLLMPRGAVRIARRIVVALRATALTCGLAGMTVVVEPARTQPDALDEGEKQCGEPDREGHVMGVTIRIVVGGQRSIPLGGPCTLYQDENIFRLNLGRLML